jgi:hypothetical protein
LFRWHVRYEEVHGGRRHAANHRFPRRSLAHLARRCLTPSIPRSRRTTGEVLTLLSDDACDAFLDLCSGTAVAAPVAGRQSDWFHSLRCKHLRESGQHLRLCPTVQPTQSPDQSGLVNRAELIQNNLAVPALESTGHAGWI